MPTRPLRALLFLLGFWLALVLLQPIGTRSLAAREPAPAAGLPGVGSPPPDSPLAR